MRMATKSRVLCQHVQQLVNLQSINCNHLLILDIIGLLLIGWIMSCVSGPV